MWLSSSGPTIRNENYGLSPVPLQLTNSTLILSFLLIKGSNEILECEQFPGCHSKNEPARWAHPKVWLSSSGPTIRNENYGLSPVPLQGHHDVDKLDINCLRCTRISSILHGQQCPIAIIVWIPSSIAKSCTTHSSIHEIGVYFWKTWVVL